MAKHRRHSKGSRRTHNMLRGGGLKGSALELIGGAVVGFGAAKLAEHYEMMRRAWWVTPLVSALGGHVVKAKIPKMRDAGAGMIGGAGTMAYYNYKLSQAGSASSGTSAVMDASGVDDVDYVKAFQSLPEAAGVQPDLGPTRMRSSVMGLQG